MIILSDHARASPNSQFLLQITRPTTHSFQLSKHLLRPAGSTQGWNQHFLLNIAGATLDNPQVYISSAHFRSIITVKCIYVTGESYEKEGNRIYDFDEKDTCRLFFIFYPIDFTNTQQ